MSFADDVVRMYLDDQMTICQIVRAAARKTTTYATVRGHLERRGVGSVRYCKICRTCEETRATP
jgi:hypothetical protein